MIYYLYAKTCHKQDEWVLVGRYSKIEHAVEEYLMFREEKDLPDYFYLSIEVEDPTTRRRATLMFYARDGYYGI